MSFYRNPFHSFFCYFSLCNPVVDSFLEKQFVQIGWGLENNLHEIFGMNFFFI